MFEFYPKQNESGYVIILPKPSSHTEGKHLNMQMKQTIPLFKDTYLPTYDATKFRITMNRIPYKCFRWIFGTFGAVRLC